MTSTGSTSGGAAQLSARRFAAGDGLAEDALQTIVVQHLQLRAKSGAVWFHVPNGGSRSRVVGRRFKAQGVVAGAPDLVIFLDGLAFALELKTLKGRLSGSQKAMHQALEPAGVNVAVAYGINEALNQLTRWGITS